MMSPQIAALDAAVELSKEPMEGNILYMHQSREPNPKNLAKQRNLFSLAASLPLEDSTIIEIGFNAGHSSLLMLFAHPKVRIIAFDLCEHSYTEPCFQILVTAFPGRIQLVPGRSQQTLPRWAQNHRNSRADLLHIDGDHDPHAARADLRNAKAVARDEAWVVFDDTCFSPLRAVWNEALDSKLLQVPDRVKFCPTNRHGIARYHRPKPKREEPLWDLAPALAHRGRMRHVLVLAPTDHGQDSLLGYVSRHRLCKGHTSKQSKLVPNTKERHQSEWLSLPLCYAAEDPILVQLVAPHFSDVQQINDCFPIVDGALIVVDCAEGLTEDFCQVFQAAMAHNIQPVLFLNKLDKLLSLEPNNELCYQKLSLIIDRLNDLLATSEVQAPNSKRSLHVDEGNVLFGRGSLSVAESIGGWGFRLEDLLTVQANHKGWTEEQVSKLRPRLWGEHFHDGRRWSDRANGATRGFCKLVLQPLREIYGVLEAPSETGLLGVVPKEDLVGNAWKQSAMEAWLPLVDTLLNALALKVPAPKAPPANSVFYAARCVESLDGQCFALGRHVAAQAIAPNLPHVTALPGSWLLNGPAAVPLEAALSTVPGAMLGLSVDSPPLGVALTVG
ncbi:Elongation factor 2 (EF-2) [Durusdinium trenchii]|uniref:Elongation factor 2 (EF-2) n=1 Tax=Durusdinium trenchii TaxID=1381693 RepID=A0ABP0S3Y1_9DINO